MSDLVLNALRRKLAATDDPDRVAALEARITERETNPPPQAPETPPAAPVGASEELTGLSKADLLDLAEDADIEGRSSMTKAELVEALTEGT